MRHYLILLLSFLSMSLYAQEESPCGKIETINGFEFICAGEQAFGYSPAETVTIIDTVQKNGCPVERQLYIIVHPSLNLDLELEVESENGFWEDDIYIIPLGEEIIIHPIVYVTEGNIFGDTIVSFDVMSDTLVSIVISNENGCSVQDTISVRVVENTTDETELVIFNGISPNGDGTNDVFSPKTIHGESLPFKIFNRWGNLVFDSVKEGKAEWNGTYKNVPVPDGTYFYVIPLDGNKKPISGFIEVHR